MWSGHSDVPYGTFDGSKTTTVGLTLSHYFLIPFSYPPDKGTAVTGKGSASISSFVGVAPSKWLKIAISAIFRFAGSSVLLV